jgi:hypothetical protein
MESMTHSDSGNAPWRIILVQILLLGAVLIFLKVYLPHHQRQLEAERLVQREQKITSFFQNSVVEDSNREISVSLDGMIVKRHPQHLRTVYSPDDVETDLGAPQTSMTDFQGGQHLTWVGTGHRLEAAFTTGRLYCITWADLTTHRGVLVYESEDLWHPY